MPLYLVRWPGMEASLVSAQDERDLANILDEVASPTECTWSEYTGPLWIDVDLNLDIEIDGPREEATAASVSLANVAGLEESMLRLGQPQVETVEAMVEEIMALAFPNTHDLFAEAREQAFETGEEEWLPGVEAIKRAVANDVVEQGKAVLEKGVTFDEEGALVPTTTWYLLRRSKNRFEKIGAPLLREFTLGIHPLKPGRDGLVRVAVATLVGSTGELPEVEVRETGYQFRTDPAGKIVDVHRADAFAQEDAASPGPFEVRRNEAVQWLLTEDDVRAVQKTVERLMGVG